MIKIQTKYRFSLLILLCFFVLSATCPKSTLALSQSSSTQTSAPQENLQSEVNHNELEKVPDTGENWQGLIIIVVLILVLLGPIRELILERKKQH